MHTVCGRGIIFNKLSYWAFIIRNSYIYSYVFNHFHLQLDEFFYTRFFFSYLDYFFKLNVCRIIWVQIKLHSVCQSNKTFKCETENGTKCTPCGVSWASGQTSQKSRSIGQTLQRGLCSHNIQWLFQSHLDPVAW